MKKKSFLSYLKLRNGKVYGSSDCGELSSRLEERLLSLNLDDIKQVEDIIHRANAIKARTVISLDEEGNKVLSIYKTYRVSRPQDIRFRF